MYEKIYKKYNDNWLAQQAIDFINSPISHKFCIKLLASKIG